MNFDREHPVMAILVRLRMLVVLIILVIAATLLTKDHVFLTAANLKNVARQVSFETLIAFGMTLVIITGGIDLSVGSLVAMTGVFAGMAMRWAGESQGLGPVPCIVLGCASGIAAGALAGSLSGAVITLFGLPPFIVTLAGMLVARGLAFILCAGQPISALPPELMTLGRGYLFEDVIGQVVPIPVAIMGVGFVIFHVLLTRTVFGRSVIAVGSNEEAARLSGIGVRRTKLGVYILTGGMCGLAGVLNDAYLMSADPKAADMLELNVIAAVVVGGTSLFGGRGSIVGTLLGALIIGVLNNSLNLLHVQHFWQLVVLGSVILGASLLDAGLRRLGSR